MPEQKVTILVQPEEDGGWVVVDGTQRLKRFLRKRDATLAGRDYLRHNGGGELVITNLSGRLVERDTVPG